MPDKAPTADTPSLQGLLRAARDAELRMRVGRALAALPTALTLALGAAGVALVLSKLYLVSDRVALASFVGAAISLVGTLVWAAAKRLPPRAGAIALDRYHRLDGRVTNALEFAELAPGGRRRSQAEQALMGAAIDDACRVAGRLSARRAVRMMFPGELGISALVGLVVLGLSFLEVALDPDQRQPVATAQASALEMSADDLELFKDALAELDKDEQNPDVKAAIERFNQLIEDIEGRRLNREDAFRRMQEIENELLAGAEADKKALEKALEETADELDKSELTKPVADSLKKNDLGSAEKQMQALAERLKSKEKPDKAELDRLRQALDRASKNKQKALEQLQEKRAELEKHLLKKKSDPNAPKNKKEEEEEKRLLKKEKRELERLNRDIENKQRALRRLSKLDRNLAKAAADLLRDLGMSGEDLQRAAEDLNRLQQEQMSDKDKEELRRRLQELRELIRQQGQGGEKMRQRLQRFMRQARGGKGARGQRGQGDRGQGREGEGQNGEGQQGREGQGQDGEGKGPGQGDKPGGIGIGPGGEPIPVEMPGGSGDGSGEEPGGDGRGEGGDEFGHGSGGDPKGNPTDLKSETHDVRADGLDTGQGPSNAEVILSAAQRGFTGKPYKKVYREYKTVAEDQVNVEKIPDGMRFYVRRYFQLIRPRE